MNRDPSGKFTKVSPEQPRSARKTTSDVDHLASGPQASIPEKTAEAVGERVGDAYADPGSAPARNPSGKIARPAGGPHERSSGNGAAGPVLGAVRQVTQAVSQRFDEQPF